MRNNKAKKLTSVIVCTILLLFSVACTINLNGEPYLVDRSKDWNVACIVTEEQDIRIFDAERNSFYSVYFKGSELNNQVYLPDNVKSNEDMMQYCMSLAFGSRLIDIGNGQIQEKEIKDGLHIYCTDDTMVIVDAHNQMLIQCVDIRLQSQFSNTNPSQLKEGVLVYQTDLACLTRDELKQYGQYTNQSLIGDPIHYQDGELPLTVEGAFHASVSSVYEKYQNSPGSIGTIGGDFRVYDLQNANSWLIIGNKFMQILEKDTGDQLLLTRPGDDLSVRVSKE